MKLIRYTDLNDWESLFGDPFRAFAPLLRSAANPVRRGNASRALPTGVEWFEDDGHYHARLEVPGVKREQLRLDVEDGLVRLTHHESGQTGCDRGPPRRRHPAAQLPQGRSAQARQHHDQLKPSNL